VGKRSRTIGLDGEEKAAAYLQERGFLILERNFRAKFGEIDIVAQKDGVIHFIEVKTSTKYEPIYAITPAKMRKLFKAIDFFLLTHDLALPYQIDALLVKSSEMEFVENISI